MGAASAQAFASYADDVRSGRFPGKDESWE
jgi:ketopantoate hydroxymethyltransferase